MTEVEQKLARALEAALPKEVRMIARVLHEHKKRAWVVGGSVRDVLSEVRALKDPARGGSAHNKALQGDWDLATDARPAEVQAMFRKVIPTGIEHGTVTVVLSGQHFEVTTLRGEVGHSDGRRPDAVYFVEDLTEDLKRRDFTVNAIAYDIVAQTLHDPWGGIPDHEAQLLRAVGVPAERFAEDGLRVLRCARFAATLGFSIEKETERAISPSLPSFEKVAQERVRDEWLKALRSDRPEMFLRVVRSHGLLDITFPELWPIESESSADPISSFSFEDALLRVKEAPADFLCRLAVFAGLGRSEAERQAWAKRIAERLRLSRSENARLERLMVHGPLSLALLERPEGELLRRWLSLVSREHAADVLNLAMAFREPKADQELILRALRLAHEELARRSPLSLKELAVSGQELISQADIPPGPRVGVTLQKLLDEVLTDPTKNEPDVLLKLARAYDQRA